MPCKRLNSRLGKVPQWTATRLICWGTVHYPSLFLLSLFFSLHAISSSEVPQRFLAQNPLPSLCILHQRTGLYPLFYHFSSKHWGCKNILWFCDWVWIYFVAVIFLIWLALVFVLAESWGIENLGYQNYVFPPSSFCRLWCFHPYRLWKNHGQSSWCFLPFLFYHKCILLL